MSSQKDAVHLVSVNTTPGVARALLAKLIKVVTALSEAHVHAKFC
jgi:hypothetical protein